MIADIAKLHSRFNSFVITLECTSCCHANTNVNCVYKNFCLVACLSTCEKQDTQGGRGTGFTIQAPSARKHASSSSASSKKNVRICERQTAVGWAYSMELHPCYCQQLLEQHCRVLGKTGESLGCKELLYTCIVLGCVTACSSKGVTGEYAHMCDVFVLASTR